MKGNGFSKYLLLSAVTIFALAGCDTSNSSIERGPDGTIAYHVPINSSEPGTRIEVNGESVGVTPTTLKIFGDRDGTFHNFGFDEVIVRAYPRSGGGSQSKVFHTGTISVHDDKIPEKIYFDFGSVPNNSAKSTVNQ